MPLCGYHPLMASGIAEFAEGLVRSLAEKALRRSLSVTSQFASEQDEIFILRASLAARLSQRLPPQEAREARAFAGLIELAGYLMAVDDGAPADRAAFEEGIRARATRFGQIMEDFDTAFDAACESASVVAAGDEAYEEAFRNGRPKTAKAAA